jgi:para-aminobenzoate synthetase component 1
MHDIKHITGNITGISIKRLETKLSFFEMASRFSKEAGTVTFMSGGSLDCARYHILGIRPWMHFFGKGNLFTIQLSDSAHRLEENPFDILKAVLAACRVDEMADDIPFGAGLMGYLSYDLKDYIEELPRTSIDDLNLPVISLFAPSIILIYDNRSQGYTICVPEKDGLPVISMDDAESILLSAPEKVLKNREGFFNPSCTSFRSNFTQAEYELVILKIREYIASGHVYQVNMSQRFEMDYPGDPFSLFMKLFSENPAPFFAYINAGDHQIVSTSPERFLTLKGNRVETRPIKGTKPRGKTAEEDEMFRSQLVNSKKDEAELSMIVDLMRNDIGKVCEASSVRVKEHKRLEAYENVYHLVSIVEGRLKKGFDETDLLKAAFPGGSITGCPKVRAMEIIDELEPNRRHVYTGSIGYIGFHRSMDLSIAIRTATICNNRIYFAFGGGVVYDSDPLDEYTETLHKGKTIMEALKKREDENIDEPVAWINGSIKPLSAGAVKLTDLGVQYGYGFFETIRVNSGRISCLDDHMERFRNTWETLFENPFPDLTWDKIIRQVIKANRLDKCVAAVKILATFGDRDTTPYNRGLYVTAKPYNGRSKKLSETGIKLGIYPEPRSTTLADHKTLNYLHYYMAGRWAKKNGFDEAVILNSDKSLSETNTANILILRDQKVIRPFSDHVLKGVMEKHVCAFLNDLGYHIESKRVVTEDILSSDSMIITNSLVGALSVSCIGTMELSRCVNLCDRINLFINGI